MYGLQMTAVRSSLDPRSAKIYADIVTLVAMGQNLPEVSVLHAMDPLWSKTPAGTV